MPSLIIALAIVCAFNGVCERPVNSVQRGSLSLSLMGEYDSRSKIITVNNQMQTPSIIANIIVHEDVHAKQDREGRLRDTCVNTELPAYKAQVDEWAWFERQEWAGPIIPATPEEMLTRISVMQMSIGLDKYTQEVCNRKGN